MSISKNKSKLIRSLNDKKNRDETGLFVAEGDKIVGELLHSSHRIPILYATKEWLTQHASMLQNIEEVIETGTEDLRKISNLNTPNQVLSIVETKIHTPDYRLIKLGLSLVLDDIQDPGNLGTILRIADWFGIKDVICSENTVDTYNPKVVQSSMGAFLRVRHYHLPLELLFKECSDIDIYGALLNGKNIYSEPLNTNGLIVMGNESKGISNIVQKYINRKIMIPGFPIGHQGAESLNVSVATGIVCAEFRRREIG